MCVYNKCKIYTYTHSNKCMYTTEGARQCSCDCCILFSHNIAVLRRTRAEQLLFMVLPWCVCVCVCVCVCMGVCVCVCMGVLMHSLKGHVTHMNESCCADAKVTSHRCRSHGVATISRLIKMIGLFCKRALQKR